MRARNAEPSAAALGHRDALDRAARCSRRAPAPTRRPACRHRSRRCGAARARVRRVAASMHAAGDEPRRLERGPPHRGRIVGEVEIGEHRAPVGVVDGDRSPRGYGAQTGTGAARRVARAGLGQQPGRPVAEQAARVARPADEELARRRCAGSPSSPGPSSLARRDRPDDQRRAEEHEHVAVVVRAGDDLVGQRVDATRREHRAVGAADPAALPRRSARAAAAGRPGSPSRRRDLAGPTRPVEQRDRRSTRSTCRAPPRRTARGSRPPVAGQNAVASGCLGRGPAQEPEHSPLSTRVRAGRVGARPAALVAVQQPGRDAARRARRPP